MLELFENLDKYPHKILLILNKNVYICSTDGHTLAAFKWAGTKCDNNDVIYSIIDDLGPLLNIPMLLKLDNCNLTNDIYGLNCHLTDEYHRGDTMLNIIKKALSDKHFEHTSVIPTHCFSKIFEICRNTDTMNPLIKCTEDNITVVNNHNLNWFILTMPVIK
jgi:hypothetical protein